jgi:hypothetical protein
VRKFRTRSEVLEPWCPVAAVRRACEAVPDDAWGWVQLYCAIAEKELTAMDGSEIIAAILAIFNEVTPAMNLVMSVPFLTVSGRSI